MSDRGLLIAILVIVSLMLLFWLAIIVGAAIFIPMALVKVKELGSEVEDATDDVGDAVGDAENPDHQQ